MSIPRLGRGLGLAALAEHRPDTGFRPDPLPHVMARLAEPERPCPVNRERLATLAASIATQLEPLPRALDVVAIRARRRLHPGPRQREDEELVAALDLLRARTFALWLDVGRLAREAATGASPRRTSTDEENARGPDAVTASTGAPNGARRAP